MSEEQTKPDEPTVRQVPAKLGVGISALLVLATICGVLAFATTWADRQLLQTDQWRDTSAELIEQPEIRDAVAQYLVDQLFANVDVQGELQASLPENLKGLSGPATAGLRELADRAADRAFESPKVQQAWVNANDVAHKTAIKIIEGGDERVSVLNGVVTIDLRLMLADLAKRVGVGEKLVSKIPDNAAQFVVLQSDELELAQDGYDTLKAAKAAFSVLTILLFALAIGLATGRRRRAAAFTGAAFIGLGASVLLLTTLLRQPAVDALASTVAVRPAVFAVFDISTGLLRDQANSIIVTGVLVLIGVWLASGSRPAVAFRAAVAPFLRHQPAASAAVAAVLYLLLIWWAPTIGFRTGIGLLINTLFAVAGFAGLVHLTRREYPDAAEPDFEAMQQRVKELFTGERATELRERSKQMFARKRSPADELERLADLRDRGVISDEEFAAQKKKLLGT